ncbi:MAG: prepilin-type N-terminal cleavage/methylation domain-containing protein [Candidatus Nanopelagicales bacterium]
MFDRLSKRRGDAGFTLIELLVVMIIIGILAAIGIPIFLSQRAKARDTATQADVSTVGKEIATYYVDNVGAPPVVTVAAGELRLDGVKVGNASDGTAFGNQTGLTSTTWCVSLTNPEGDTPTYRYSSAGGLEAGACA